MAICIKKITWNKNIAQFLSAPWQGELCMTPRSFDIPHAGHGGKGQISLAQDDTLKTTAVIMLRPSKHLISPLYQLTQRSPYQGEEFIGVHLWLN